MCYCWMQTLQSHGKNLSVRKKSLIWVLFFFSSSFKEINPQAPVKPELPTRDVLRLSRLRLNSYSKTVKKYSPKIEHRGFFGIIFWYAFVKLTKCSRKFTLFMVFMRFFFILRVRLIQFALIPSQASLIYFKSFISFFSRVLSKILSQELTWKDAWLIFQCVLFN